MPYPISAVGTGLTDWEKALSGIRAGGNTSCGCAITSMIRSKQKVEQVVIITDEEENNAPCLITELRRYGQLMGNIPNLVIVQVKNANGHWDDRLERQAAAEGLTFEKWRFEGDYMSLPGLIPLLTGGSKLDLLMDIMEFPLPQRKTT